MKTYIILFIALLLQACKTENTTKANTNIQINGYTLQVYVIDSCEYIGNLCGSGSILTHKGNCRFCAQRKQNIE